MQSDVRGSKALALVLLGGLLAVPMLLLIGTALHPTRSTSVEASPFLSLDQARLLPTYGRDCLRPGDCDPPLGCLEVGKTGRGLCLNSACETNSQCKPGEFCRTLRTLGNSPPLRGCDLIEGVRAEGEPCSTGLGVETERCGPGLLCNQGWCGRPCHLQEPSACPEGFFCQSGLDGPSCVPTCERQACSAGLQCAREAGGISVCARVLGGDCPATPCPEDSRCTFTNVRATDAGLSLRLECVPSCGEALPPCPAGWACVADRCQRTCDPRVAESCYPEERCIHRVDLGLSLCKQVR